MLKTKYNKYVNKCQEAQVIEVKIILKIKYKCPSNLF